MPPFLVTAPLLVREMRFDLHALMGLALELFIGFPMGLPRLPERFGIFLEVFFFPERFGIFLGTFFLPKIGLPLEVLCLPAFTGAGPHRAFKGTQLDSLWLPVSAA